MAIQDGDDESTLVARVQKNIKHHIYPLAVQWCIEGKARLVDQGVALDGELLPASGFQYSA